MSTTHQISDATVERIRSARDDLKALAESELRCAKYAQELLALIDENGGDL